MSRAERLQAAVAFWTVNERLFDASLAEVLKHEESFLCADVHLPTDIDALASLAATGANIRIYAEEIPTYTASGRKEPPALLHAKMLLFFMKDGTAELWVGSHNWTNRAILGLNVEASLVVTLREGAPLLTQAAGYLDRVRAISDAFDPANVEFYKQLQRPASVDVAHVIELEADDAEAFADVVIGLFGTDAADLDELGTVGRNIHVSLSDPDSKSEYFYPATILHSGLLASDDASAGGISFTPRRHAFRQGRKFPVVLPEDPIGTDILEHASYFVTLHLAHIDWNVVAVAVPPKASAWEENVDEHASALLDRLQPAAWSILFGQRRPRVKRPRTEALRFADADLAERKRQPERGLVMRRVLRRREEKT
jgi:hypothetical protein